MREGKGGDVHQMVGAFRDNEGDDGGREVSQDAAAAPGVQQPVAKNHVAQL